MKKSTPMQQMAMLRSSAVDFTLLTFVPVECTLIVSTFCSLIVFSSKPQKWHQPVGAPAPQKLITKYHSDFVTRRGRGCHLLTFTLSRIGFLAGNPDDQSTQWFWHYSTICLLHNLMIDAFLVGCRQRNCSHSGFISHSGKLISRTLVSPPPPQPGVPRGGGGWGSAMFHQITREESRRHRKLETIAADFWTIGQILSRVMYRLWLRGSDVALGWGVQCQMVLCLTVTFNDIWKSP